MLQHQFHHLIQTEFSFLKHQNFTIAISGGIDSVVLAYLCKQENLKFSLAHCNFHLRAEESDADQAFVESLAKQLSVPCFVKHFDTKSLVKNDAQSIQLIAREIRYKWFEELCKNEQIKHILVAHHLNDRAETFFINLLRGTGLSGLSGIPVRNGRIVRPLLDFSRAEIRNFAKEHHIQWREDCSNATDHYLRNRIRHHMIPFLENENADFLTKFKLTQRNLQDSEVLLVDYIERLKEELWIEKSDYVEISIEKLQEKPHFESILYHLLKDYGFTAWDDIVDLLTAQPGKQVLATNYRLLKDRATLLLKRVNPIEKIEFEIGQDEKEVEFSQGKLICENITKIRSYDKQIAYLSASKLAFPLKLRHWKPGDAFQPFGMTGRKKVSDFLRDEKVSLFDKENTWVLVSGNQIVWVVGHRIDHNFKVDDQSNILKIEWIK